MDTCVCIRNQFPIKLILIQYCKLTIHLYKLKAEFWKTLMSRDSWSSLNSQDSRYDAGDARVGAEIETLSEVAFSWALVSFCF